MASITGVVNRGLMFIGSARIVSLDDGSASANAVNDIYADTLDDLLRAHPWNFATKRILLARSSTSPAFGFDYAYPLPSDWIKNISAHDNDAGDGTIDYRTEVIGEAEQNAIITSADTVYLRYVSRVTDPNRMSADFRTALSAAIAEAVAIKLTSSNALYESMVTKAARKLSTARSTDGLDSTPEKRQRGSWANSRGGGRSDRF